MSELNAYLDGELCGTFMEKNGQITFAYSPGYESAVPLSLSMPERNRAHKNKVALPFLKGLLPRSSFRKYGARSGCISRIHFWFT